jgi:hypothetical protein
VGGATRVPAALLRWSAHLPVPAQAARRRPASLPRLSRPLQPRRRQERTALVPHTTQATDDRLRRRAGRPGCRSPTSNTGVRGRTAPISRCRGSRPPPGRRRSRTRFRVSGRNPGCLGSERAPMCSDISSPEQHSDERPKRARSARGAHGFGRMTPPPESWRDRSSASSVFVPLCFRASGAVARDALCSGDGKSRRHREPASARHGCRRAPRSAVSRFAQLGADRRLSD